MEVQIPIVLKKRPKLGLKLLKELKIETNKIALRPNEPEYLMRQASHAGDRQQACPAPHLAAGGWFDHEGFCEDLHIDRKKAYRILLYRLENPFQIRAVITYIKRLSKAYRTYFDMM